MKHPREMRPRLIGFCGRAGAGKTFAATHLVSNCGYTRVRYAEPLKAMMRALGLTEAETDGGAKERPCALPARLKNAALPKQTGETKIPEVFPEVDRVEAPAD